MRSVKSPREIEYARRAATLADDAWDEAVRLARPGAFEGDILAAMQGAVFRGGGDYAGNEFFLHMIVMNSDTGRAMTVGHSVLVTDDGCESLSRSSVDLVVN